MGTFLEIPIIRTIVYWGLYWGPLILGNYHKAPSDFVSSCPQDPRHRKLHLPYSSLRSEHGQQSSVSAGIQAAGLGEVGPCRAKGSLLLAGPSHDARPHWLLGCC